MVTKRKEMWKKYVLQSSIPNTVKKKKKKGQIVRSHRLKNTRYHWRHLGRESQIVREGRSEDQRIKTRRQASNYTDRRTEIKDLLRTRAIHSEVS